MSTITFDNELIITLRQQLSNAEHIAIVSHANPDGDCVGSVLAMRNLLCHHLGKTPSQVTMILPNACPETFRYLEHTEEILSADSNADAGEWLRRADTVLCLDFNNAGRVGALQKPLEDTAAYRILIDHHTQPDEQLFPLLFSMPDISSTCELLYWIILQAWGLEAFDTAMARCLYTGICTDTGSFSYSCEDSSLYEAAAGLAAYPIHAAEIHNHINNCHSVARMRFLGFCLYQRMRIFEEEGLAYMYVSKADMQEFGVGPRDLEGFVNETLSMKAIHVGAMLREEEEGTVRISFRSKYNFDVNQFARTHFGGGGHVKASGATVHAPFAETVQRVETLLRDALHKHTLMP